VQGVASSGTFVKDTSMTGWTTGTSGIPNGWTVKHINAIVIDVGEGIENEPIEITVSFCEDYDGDCSIIVNGTTYTTPSRDGKAVFTISSLPAGAYTIYAETQETDEYEAASATDTFTVEPA
jgi:hypothetical protein